MNMSLLIYTAIFALAIFNGIFSAHSFTLFALQGIWYPKFLPAPLNMMFVLSGMVSALLHLMVTGVPAAVLEKLLSLPRKTTGLIWLSVMLLPTYQTLQHIDWI